MYTINGKEYTELDINRKCCELNMVAGFCEDESGIYNLREDRYFDPCYEPQDTWPIIEKCWDELMEWVEHSGDTLSGNSEWGDIHGIKWEFTMQKHNCTKLVAACICFIEVKEGE